MKWTWKYDKARRVHVGRTKQYVYFMRPDQSPYSPVFLATEVHKDWLGRKCWMATGDAEWGARSVTWCNRSFATMRAAKVAAELLVEKALAVLRVDYEEDKSQAWKRTASVDPR